MFHKNKIEQLQAEKNSLARDVERLTDKVEYLLNQRHKDQDRLNMVLNHLGIEIVEVPSETKVVKRKVA